MSKFKDYMLNEERDYQQFDKNKLIFKAVMKKSDENDDFDDKDGQAWMDYDDSKIGENVTSHKFYMRPDGTYYKVEGPRFSKGKQMDISKAAMYKEISYFLKAKNRYEIEDNRKKYEEID